MTNTLVLAPTSFELDRVQARIADRLERANGAIELCGFGVIASASRSAFLIEKYQPNRVLLVGIAGGLTDAHASRRSPGAAMASELVNPKTPQSNQSTAALKVGTAACFDRVACYGIGAGTGNSFLSASDIGWKHWTGAVEIEDQIGIGIDDAEEISRHGTLLTCCSASADEGDVSRRRKAFPDATAEDMEGFSVAVSCRLADKPLEIVRGISNRAGDRDKSNWRISEALDAAADLVLKLIDQSDE
ncbi:MAG: hypothetical protein CMJ78_18155 [Planctomycetaceae bacterium]|nr:hypothetical protein [Planctomycetaceae bacterium]